MPTCGAGISIVQCLAVFSIASLLSSFRMSVRVYAPTNNPCQALSGIDAIYLPGASNSGKSNNLRQTTTSLFFLDFQANECAFADIGTVGDGFPNIGKTGRPDELDSMGGPIVGNQVGAQFIGSKAIVGPYSPGVGNDAGQRVCGELPLVRFVSRFDEQLKHITI